MHYRFLCFWIIGIQVASAVVNPTAPVNPVPFGLSRSPFLHFFLRSVGVCFMIQHISLLDVTQSPHSHRQRHDGVVGDGLMWIGGPC